MKNSEYWKDRMVELELKALEKGEKYYQNLQEQYDIAIHNINKDITVWYERLAKNNEISLAEAKKLLDKNELKEFQWTLQDYIKYGEENAVSQNWMKELENASAKQHISRLQLLQIQMKQHLEKLANTQEKGIKGTLSDIYSDTYYHTAYEVQKGFHTGWAFDKLDTNRIEKALNQGWLDGKNFSDRIWTNKEKLVSVLNTELTQMIIRGESPDRAIQAISAKMGVSKKQAGKLVMTESSMIASVSQKDCFLNLGVKQFEIVGTLDRDTCETCGSLDGTHLSMTDYAVGQTAPPFHANCRCCTAPYFPDDEGYRFARDEEGKSHYIDSHIKYDDWKKKFVEKSEKSDIMLNKNEQRAIIQYLSSESYKINEALRNNQKLSDNEINFRNDLDVALEKCDNYEGNIVRTLDIVDQNLLNKFLKKIKEPVSIWNEYLSFSNKENYNENANIRIYVNSHRAKDLRKYNPEESEIVYPRNSIFVTKNIVKKDNIYYILLEEK